MSSVTGHVIYTFLLAPKYALALAKNKHALIRYRALDACFRNHKVRYSFKELMAAVNKALEDYDPATKGISRSMLYEDIAFMESSDGWRCEIDRRREGKYTYLRYADPDFSIGNGPLNAVEVAQLQEALKVLSQFKGLPQFEWMEAVIAKLNQDMQSEQEEPIISFDGNQYLKGIEWLGAIYNAVRYQKVLCVSYQHFGATEPYEVVFHPYHLKQYNNRWFAFGHSPASPHPLQTIALDRIKTVAEREAVYIPNENTDFSTYFEDIIGVTQPTGGVLQSIVLHFALTRSGYVQTKPLHGSQRAKVLEDGALEVQLSLILNREFLQLLLSFGADVEVVSPAELREEMEAEVERLRAVYKEK